MKIKTSNKLSFFKWVKLCHPQGFSTKHFLSRNIFAITTFLMTESFPFSKKAIAGLEKNNVYILRGHEKKLKQIKKLVKEYEGLYNRKVTIHLPEKYRRKAK